MLRQWLNSLVDLFYPNHCVACGRELKKGESQICTYCRWDMPFTDFQHQAKNYVTELFSARFPFENACSLFYFKGEKDIYRQMIHRMKYSSRRDIAYTLGEILGSELLRSELYKNIDLLVPIPLHWTRRIYRGYNQSEEICRGMSVVMGIPFNFSVIKRVKFTRQQARRTRRERWENVSGAFSVVDSETLKDKHVLLIDDVLTSGSTLESCAAEIIRKTPTVRLSLVTLAVAKRGMHYRSSRNIETISEIE